MIERVKSPMGQTDRLSCDPTSELLDNYIVLMYTMYNPIRKACLNQRYYTYKQTYYRSFDTKIKK